MTRTVALTRAVLLAFALTMYGLSESLAQDARPDQHPESVIARARVWMPTDIPSMDLRLGPVGPHSFEPRETITCAYVDKELGGASPKFACRLAHGDELKVKYGGANEEV